jgi:hypothetical protein
VEGVAGFGQQLSVVAAGATSFNKRTAQYRHEGRDVRVGAVQTVGAKQLVQVDLPHDDGFNGHVTVARRGHTLRSASPRMLAMPELCGIERSALLPIIDV